MPVTRPTLCAILWLVFRLDCHWCAQESKSYAILGLKVLDAQTAQTEVLLVGNWFWWTGEDFLKKPLTRLTLSAILSVYLWPIFHWTATDKILLCAKKPHAIEITGESLTYSLNAQTAQTDMFPGEASSDVLLKKPVMWLTLSAYLWLIFQWNCRWWDPDMWSLIYSHVSRCCGLINQ